MNRTFTEGETFKGVAFTEKGLPKGDYEDCVFDQCIFSASDLSNHNFVECEFVDCDLSTAKIASTSFQDIRFIRCKVLGVHFERCNEFLFSVNFEGCQLNLSSFYQRSLKKTKFKDCNLGEVDFVEADLTKAVFDNCNLEGAIFENTLLPEADLSTSYNFSIDPEINRIHKAKFSKAGVVGLLGKYNITVE